VRRLIKKGEQRGFVTFDELNALYARPERHLDEIDALCQDLAAREVEVVSAPPNEWDDGLGEQVFSRLSRELSHADELDAFRLYLAEIANIPPLQEHEEITLPELVRAAQWAGKQLEKHAAGTPERAVLESMVRQGDEARRRLVESHLTWAVAVVCGSQRRDVPFMDLLQEANIALLKSAKTWDAGNGDFLGYATWWMQQAIERTSSSLFPLPPYARCAMDRVREALTKLEHGGDEEISWKTLEELSGVSSGMLDCLLAVPDEVWAIESLACCPDQRYGRRRKKQVARIIGCWEYVWATRFGFMAGPDDEFEVPPCLADVLGTTRRVADDCLDGQILDPRLEFELHEESHRLLAEALEDVLACLSVRERRVMMLLFGIGGQKPMSIRAIAAKYKLREKTVRDICAKAFRKLRHPMRSRGLKAFLWPHT